MSSLKENSDYSEGAESKLESDAETEKYSKVDPSDVGSAVDSMKPSDAGSENNS